MRYLNAPNVAYGEDRRTYKQGTNANTTDRIFNVSYDNGRVDVYLNGVKLYPVDDYTKASSGVGSSITLISDLGASNVLECIGYQGINSGNGVTEDRFVVGTSSTGSGGAYGGSTTVFNVSSNSGSLVSVWQNGVKLVHTTDFTVDSGASTVTLGSAATSADEITVQVVGILNHANVVPSQSSQSGKFLTTNGSSASWATVDLSSIEADLVKIRSDIAINALRYAVTENKNAYNLPNSFIDNFNDSSGVGTFTSTARNTDEYISSQSYASAAYQDWDDISGFDEDSFIQAGNTFVWTGDDKASWMDSLSSNSNTSKALYINGFQDGSPAWQTGTSFVLDFETANQKIDHIKLLTVGGVGSSARFHEVSVHTSLDNTSYTQQNIRLGTSGSYASTLNLADNNDEKQISLETATVFRYLKFQIHSVQVSGNGNPELARFNTYTQLGTIGATGSIISTANVPSSARTKVSGVILYKDNEGTATLSSDLKVSFTTNGGTNWTELDSGSDYTAITPVFSTGIKMARLAEKTCVDGSTNPTSGSDIRYRVEWASQSAGVKETQLHGIALNY